MAEIPRAGVGETDAAVARAKETFPAWRAVAPGDRSVLLHQLADALADRQEDLAKLEARNAGKPISDARGEMGMVVETFRYYAGAPERLTGKTIPVAGGVDMTFREPLGVVGLITPWNFPLTIASWKIAPALAAGNTIVAKPSAETPLSTLRVARLSEEVGMPPGVLNVVSGFGADAGAHLAGHSGIDGLAFCGSVATGREVLAAAAARITPVVSLELGGKSAKLVFEDADLGAAADAAAHGVTYNAGQSCGTQSRVLVPRSKVDEFAERVRGVLAGVRVGRGVDDPDMGPLVSEAQLERVLGYIESGRAEGAQVAHGGGRGARPDGRGFFVEPTLFVGARPEMRIIREEIFGPVVSVLPFDSEEEAIEIANASEFGLSASVWTRDLARAHRVARRLDVSVVAVNGGGGFDVESPWGGVKQSGFGREGGIESMLQYSRVKAVWIDIPEAGPAAGGGGDMSEERSR